jgi:hypothetical protein
MNDFFLLISAKTGPFTCRYSRSPEFSDRTPKKMNSKVTPKSGTAAAPKEHGQLFRLSTYSSSSCGSMFIKQKTDRADRGLRRLCSMKVPFEWARSQQGLAHFFARTAAVDRSWLGGLSHWITFPDVSASSCFVTQFSSVRAPLATPCHFTSFPGFAPLLLTRETGENETRVGYGSTLKIQHVKRRVGEKGKHHGESKKQCCNIKSGRVVKFAFCVKHSLSPE